MNADLRLKVNEIKGLTKSFNDGNYVVVSYVKEGVTKFASIGEFKVWAMDESKFNSRLSRVENKEQDINSLL